MAKVNVEVVTPERRILSQQVDEAIVPGSEGLFGVRPGHAALLSLMDAGALTLRDGTSTQVFFVAGGFAQVHDDKLMVLADQAEPVASIDVAAAQKRLAEAQGKLAALSSTDAGFEAQTFAVRRETARIALAQKRA
jgi:F-type H+-transporting ATPase subunit epsilon